jgi:uncharacterized membrane protein
VNGHAATRPAHGTGKGGFAVLGLVLAILGALTVPASVTADSATVRAVLFYSPTCPHCHQVLEHGLSPIKARFGDQLEVLLVDVSTSAGRRLYQAAVEHFDVPDDRIGVPTMIVGDAVLVGSIEIPEQLPSHVERLLASGGADWPPIAGLAGLLPSPALTPLPPSQEAIAPDAAASAPVDSVMDRVARDPIGNTLAIVVLIGLLGSLAWAAATIVKAHAWVIAGPPSGWIPFLALAGLSVAAYLSGVELTGSSAVCGPVGDCNVVHTSIYARVLGIPVGLLGVAGYAAILACWVVARRSGAMLEGAATIGLFALAVAGTLFSVYLTFLEPFVLGSTCSWCLASAVLMAAILVMAAASLSRRAPNR